MVTCWRCGVDYDGAEYIPGAVCPDCQFDFPGEEFRRFDVVRAQERNRIGVVVARLAGGLKSDQEIADAIGLSRSKVSEARRQLGIRPHQIPEGAPYGYKRKEAGQL